MRLTPALLTLALVAGCSSTPSSAPAPAPTTPPTSSSAAPKVKHVVPPPDSYKSWATITDTSGLRLSMPFQKAASVDSTGSRVHEIPVANDHGVRLLVSFVDVPLTAATLKGMADDGAKPFVQQGGTDLVVGDVVAGTRAGLPSIDYTVTYTHKGKKTIRFVSITAAAKTYVLVMSGGAGAAAEGEPLQVVREYHKRMVDSIAAG